MLFLDDTLREIKKARQEHSRFVKCRINKKLFNTSCADANCPVCTHTQLVRNPSTTLQTLMNLLRNNALLESIISGKPAQLIIESNSLWRQIVPGFSWPGYDDYLRIRSIKAILRTPAEQVTYNQYDSAVKAFTTVFEYYGWFGGDDNIRYDAYQLAANLNRNTCTYCNRIYTHTIKGKNNSKIMRPQFDHWFSKSKHPALALSFYNLIPSCSVCNSSIKGALDFDLATHLHPYLDKDCQDKFTYSYEFRQSTSRFHVMLQSNHPADARIQQTCDDMKLMDVYDTHHSELTDLIKIKQSYSTKYISRIKHAFPKAYLSDKEVYRLAFGVEYDGNKFYKRPLSKFKKDILIELKLIR